MTKRSVRRRRRRHERRPPPGTAPGTLSVDPAAPPPVMQVIAYGPDGLVEQAVSDLAALPPLLARYPVTWLNVDGLGDVATIRRLGELFGLHPLALEDAVSAHQRAKVEEYKEHLFIVVRTFELREHLEGEQVSIFLGKRFVVTFQERAGDCWGPVRERLRAPTSRMREAGADYLAYALIDAGIDSYFPIIESYGERLETLEDEVIVRPTRATISAIHEIRRELLGLRRAVWPLREAINTCIRDQTGFFREETRVYLRDCYDHTFQVIDLLETYRELGSGLMETYLSSIGNRTNEVMRVLTIIATIFIPLTFIAGVYGMNFKTEASPWNMPELGWRWGYPFCLALMAGVSAALLVYFRRKGWLGGAPPIAETVGESGEHAGAQPPAGRDPGA